MCSAKKKKSYIRAYRFESSKSAFATSSVQMVQILLANITRKHDNKYVKTD